MYGEGTVAGRMCQKSFAKFWAGDYLLDDDAPRSSRPVYIDNDQIEALIENNQHYTQNIVNILKISKAINL